MIEQVGITTVFLMFHFATKWFSSRQDARLNSQSPQSLWAYLADNPAYVLMTCLGTAGGFWLFMRLGWMTDGAAASLGWAGASMAQNAAKQYENRK